LVILTHPFAPPPKQRLAQISTTQKPLSQLVQPSTAINKTNIEKQQQPAAIIPPMKSSQAIVTIMILFFSDNPLLLLLYPLAIVSYHLKAKYNNIYKILVNARDTLNHFKKL
jgi:hypothetical protein